MALFRTFSILFLILLTYSNVHAQQMIQRIKMTRTACKGKCPEYSVELKRNGQINWQGVKNVNRIGYYTAELGSREMAALFAAFEKNNFNQVQHRYISKQTGKAHLHMEVDLKIKHLYIQNAEAGPAFLATIATQIDRRVKNIKWTRLRFVPPVVTDEPVDDPAAEGEMNGVTEMDGDPGVVNVYPEVVAAPNEVLSYAEEMPEFPGGMQALKAFIQKNVLYPEMARESGISGKVFVRFVVDELGDISNVKIAKGVALSLDQEAIRVVKMMPRWRAGRMNGKPVKVHYTLPVSFVLK